MLNEQVLDKLSSKLTNNLQELNIYLIRKISEQIVDIGNLTPSQLKELYQSVKYGADIDDIVRRIAMYTDKSEKDIIKILEESAKINQEYAKKFYEYRNIKYIPYEQNVELQRLVKAIAKRTIKDFENISKTSAFGFLKPNGKIEYTELSKAYQKITDEAVLNITTGRESYMENMKRTMKTLANQGIQQIDYASGYHKRMDSAVRMNVMEGVRTLEDNLQMQFGEEFGADGVEVVHHINPAPDHSSEEGIGWHDIDGKQFSLSEEKTIKGKTYKSFEEINNSLNRPVGTLNCYHTQIPIILGVSEPMYSEEELERDKIANINGFEFEGKHYTKYEGTQLQRRLESQIRAYRDIRDSMKILEKEETDKIETNRYTKKIKDANKKYQELSKASGLPTKVELLKNIK